MKKKEKKLFNLELFHFVTDDFGINFYVRTSHILVKSSQS